MSTQSCFIEVDLPFYRKLVMDKLENNELECDLKNLEECLKLICTLEAEGQCLDLCLRLYAALRRKCNNCNIF